MEEAEKSQTFDGKTLIDGAIAGFIATVPMSLVMLALQRMLPPQRQSPLPPSEITERAAKRADVETAAQDPWHDLLTLISHFGFGATVGSLYGPLAQRAPFPKFASGFLFGLVVWFVSYQGWLPALRLLPPASKQPPKRNLIMIAAHLVWGASLGLLLQSRARSRG